MPLAAITKSTDESDDSFATLKKAKQIISRAISIGASAYNAGNIAECSKVYQDAAKEIAPLLPEYLNIKLGEADKIDGANHDAKAWGLRRAFDAIVSYQLPLVPQSLIDGKLTFEPFSKAKLPDQSESADSSTPLNKAKQIISRAISTGAPAYNAGNIAECSRVYQVAAKEIAPLLPEYLNTKLGEAEKIDGANHDAKAWGLRRAFDAIVDYQPPLGQQSLINGELTFKPSSKAQLPDQPFGVMDTVMGGRSEGGWIPKSRTFFGCTSLQNNGGFASLRWRFPSIQNWSYARGIYLKGVKHSKPQEHTFRIILKDAACEQVRANYKVVFANPKESDEHLLIPFSVFDQMEQMGNTLARSPAFNPRAVTEIGLMAIKPTVVGEFQLEFSEWGLYF
jgi:hypothetical protein